MYGYREKHKKLMYICIHFQNVNTWRCSSYREATAKTILMRNVPHFVPNTLNLLIIRKFVNMNSLTDLKLNEDSVPMALSSNAQVTANNLRGN